MAYMCQDKKKRLAVLIKAAMPKGWKYTLSVRNHSTLVLTIKSAPVDLLADVKWYEGKVRDHAEANVYHLDHHFAGENLATMRKIHDAMMDGNHDKSDIQTDYFNVGWYTDIYIGSWNKPFKVTG